MPKYTKTYLQKAADLGIRAMIVGTYGRNLW